MVITYFGLEFFKIQFGDIVIALNPASKDSVLKAARFGADIALSTLSHPDMNGLDMVSHGGKKPFEIRGPGEYEIKEVAIRGFATESNYGGEPERLSKDATRTGKQRINTVYLITLEGMKLCFLGALSGKELPEALKEVLDEVDVLFVPIGGEGVLSAADACKLAVSLEPKLIIPMHYGAVGDKGALKAFLKEGGEDGLTPVEKLTIKKKDLEGKEADIAVLKEA